MVLARASRVMEVSCASRRKKSPIRNFFSIGEDSRYARCNECQASISRGGRTTKTFNTTNLVHHLQTKHGKLYTEFQKSAAQGKAEKEQEKPEYRQVSIAQTFERGKKWDINDPRAQNIHRRVTEMIALDSQPFSIVEDCGL